MSRTQIRAAMNTIPAVATREVVAVPSLRVGDLVSVYGVILRLTECRVWWCEYTKREVSTFQTECVGSLPGVAKSVLGGYWDYLTNGWVVQGNALATALRVTL